MRRAEADANEAGNSKGEGEETGMKKGMIMLIVICLLCSMGIAGGETKNQTVVTPQAHFELPAQGRWGFLGEATPTMAVLECGVDYYTMKIVLFTTAAQQFSADAPAKGLDNPLAAQRQFAELYYQNAVNFFPQGKMQPREVLDWGLPDGYGVMARYDENLGVYDFLHNYGWISMNVFVEYRGTDSTLESVSRMVAPIFRSLRMPHEEMRGEEEENGVAFKPFLQGSAAFEVEEDVAIEAVNEWQWKLSNDRYRIYLFICDWNKMPLNVEAMTDGDLQLDNLYGLLMLMKDDAAAALHVVNSSVRVNVDMPDGQPVLLADLSSQAYLAHCYNNIGFMMVAESVDGAMDNAQLLNTCKEIAVSFHPHGTTTKEMAAAAAAEAARAAAVKEYVIITGTSAFIRVGPGTNFDRIRTGLKGEEFVCLGKEGDWFKIDLNGRVAYINDGLSKIK